MPKFICSRTYETYIRLPEQRCSASKAAHFSINQEAADSLYASVEFPANSTSPVVATTLPRSVSSPGSYRISLFVAGGRKYTLKHPGSYAEV